METWFISVDDVMDLIELGIQKLIAVDVICGRGQIQNIAL
jgi:hypothetical protein